jgi:hypothetical protein
MNPSLPQANNLPDGTSLLAPAACYHKKYDRTTMLISDVKTEWHEYGG